MVGLQRQTVQSERPYLSRRFFGVRRRRDAGFVLRTTAFDEADGNAFTVLDESDRRNSCRHICGGRGRLALQLLWIQQNDAARP